MSTFTEKDLTEALQKMHELAEAPWRALFEDNGFDFDGDDVIVLPMTEAFRQIVPPHLLAKKKVILSPLVKDALLMKYPLKPEPEIKFYSHYDFKIKSPYSISITGA